MFIEVLCPFPVLSKSDEHSWLGGSAVLSGVAFGWSLWKDLLSGVAFVWSLLKDLLSGVAFGWSLERLELTWEGHLLSY